MKSSAECKDRDDPAYEGLCHGASLDGTGILLLLLKPNHLVRVVDVGEMPDTFDGVRVPARLPGGNLEGREELIPDIPEGLFAGTRDKSIETCCPVCQPRQVQGHYHA